MRISFDKYHGAGNDFIMIDSRQTAAEQFSTELVRHLCDRHFGIGADGLILLLDDPNYDFRMKYYNSDGREGTMCGNGGRCIVAFAKALGLADQATTFIGIDGVHDANISADGIVNLKMNVARGFQKLEDGYLLDTGSPHLILFRKEIERIDVFSEGSFLRYHERFMPEGVNVNFVELVDDKRFRIRTYERGVENETLACGTGSVASAIAAFLHTSNGNLHWFVEARGGLLEVSFAHEGNEFTDLWLSGGAEKVFSGEITV